VTMLIISVLGNLSFDEYYSFILYSSFTKPLHADLGINVEKLPADSDSDFNLPFKIKLKV
jgi:hypothetical protein